MNTGLNWKKRGEQMKSKNKESIPRATAAELNALMPSVLDRAFKGEL